MRRPLHRDLPFLLLVPGIAIAMQFLCPGLGRDVDLAFYEAAVQIVPVLYLAMLVELAASFTGGGVGDWLGRLNSVEKNLRSATEKLDKRTDDDAVALGAVVEAHLEEVEEIRDALRTARRVVAFVVVAYSASALAGIAPSLIVLAYGESWTWALALVVGSIAATFTILLVTFLERLRF